MKLKKKNYNHNKSGRDSCNGSQRIRESLGTWGKEFPQIFYSRENHRRHFRVPLPFGFTFSRKSSGVCRTKVISHQEVVVRDY